MHQLERRTARACEPLIVPAHQENGRRIKIELDKITIAAVDGYCVGGGLGFTMACDFVICTERARWDMPEIDWGHHPGVGWHHADGALGRPPHDQGNQPGLSTAFG